MDITEFMEWYPEETEYIKRDNESFIWSAGPENIFVSGEILTKGEDFVNKLFRRLKNISKEDFERTGSILYDSFEMEIDGTVIGGTLVKFSPDEPSNLALAGSPEKLFTAVILKMK